MQLANPESKPFQQPKIKRNCWDSDSSVTGLWVWLPAYMLSSWSGVPFSYLHVPRETTCVFTLALKAPAVTTNFQVKERWVYFLLMQRLTEQIPSWYYCSSCLLLFLSFEVLLSRRCDHQSPLVTFYCFPQWIYIALRSCKQRYHCKKLFKLNAAFLNK